MRDGDLCAQCVTFSNTIATLEQELKTYKDLCKNLLETVEYAVDHGMDGDDIDAVNTLNQFQNFDDGGSDFDTDDCFTDDD